MNYQWRLCSLTGCLLAVMASPLAQAEPGFYYPEPDPPVEDVLPDRGAWLESQPDRRPRSGMQEWTYHRTSDGQHPSGDEQALLWLTNIARSNPPAEGVWLATSTDPDIAGGRNYFGVDTAMLQSEFNSYTPTPPAAFDVRLYRAAYNHSLDLIARDAQDHNAQFDRVKAQDFSYSSVGGNVFSYTNSALNAHAGFNIDWGPAGPGNMQTGRGHRVNKMSINRDFANAGIAMVAENNAATSVGPYVVTENYATAASWVNDGTHYNRFLVGTVWEDQNNNARYDAGEGFGNVRVQPAQGDYYAISGNAGGYAFPLTATGPYNVTFSGGPLAQPVTKSIQVSEQSILLDHQISGGTGSATYVLSVSKTGSGTITSSPAGINCGGVCSQSYAEGEVITLTASPANGYVFGGWSGACSGTQTTCAVTLNAARAVGATFQAISSTSLSSGTPVSGSVTAGGWRYYQISASASHGQLTVALSNLSSNLDLYVRQGAYPSGDAYDCRPLKGGTDAETCVLGNGTNSVWYIAVRDVQGSGGSFTLKATLATVATEYTLTVATQGEGSVISTPAGIDCGNSCSRNYPGGTPITLSAIPADGYSFGGWSGACSGNQTTCEITLNSAASVSATFNQVSSGDLASGVAVNGSVTLGEWRYYRISASAGHSNLLVELSGLSANLDLYVRQGQQPLDDAYDCRPLLGGTANESCSLPNTGATTWYIGVYGYAAGNFTLKATLSTATLYNLTVSAGSGGSVLSSPTGIDCGQTCAYAYPAGTTVTLTANRMASYLFGGWGGACANYGYQPTCQVSINAATNVSAHFTEIPTTPLISGRPLTDFISQGQWKDYLIYSTAEDQQLTVELYGLSGDIDLFVKRNMIYSNSADCFSNAYGTTSENCTLDNPAASYWYVSVNGYEAGNYTLKATLSGDDSTSHAARLINISTRANVLGNQNDAFAGFVLSGTGSQPIMLRGMGAQAGVNPSLNLLRRNDTVWESVITNDEWEEHISAPGVRALPSHLHPTDTYANDAGVLRSLEAGVYSLQLSSSGGTGREVVGVDAVTLNGPVLMNISTRAYVSGNENDAFAGFAISGEGTLKIMLRGMAAQSGVDPTLLLLKQVNNTWQPVDSNDEWEQHASASDIGALASHLQPTDTYGNDAAMLLNLGKGVYSLQLGSVGNPGRAVVGVDVVQ